MKVLTGVSLLTSPGVGSVNGSPFAEAEGVPIDGVALSASLATTSVDKNGVVRLGIWGSADEELL